MGMPQATPFSAVLAAVFLLQVARVTIAIPVQFRESDEPVRCLSMFERTHAVVLTSIHVIHTPLCCCAHKQPRLEPSQRPQPTGDLSTCHSMCDTFCSKSPGAECFCTCCSADGGVKTGCFCPQCYTTDERLTLKLLREPQFCENNIGAHAPYGCQPTFSLQLPSDVM